MEDDIITLLHQNGVAHVVEEIFSYLDYSDIKSASQVSRSWRNVLTNSRVWKILWSRNIAHLPAWNLLYKRAICQKSWNPEWSPLQACRFVGDAYEKVLRNLQQGKFTEKVDPDNKSDLFQIGSTQVVRAGYSDYGDNRIFVQNRWNLNEEESIFLITQWPCQIEQLEISEPYLIAVTITSVYSVLIWDLETKKKIQEFVQPKQLQNSQGILMNLMGVNVKCSDKVLITCCSFREVEGENSVGTLNSATKLFARQMPCDTHPETDFPVIGVRTVTNFLLNYSRGNSSLLLEDQRIILFEKDWTRAVILSINPFRIIRSLKLNFFKRVNSPLDDLPARRNTRKYWNGWLLRNKEDFHHYCFPRIIMKNIDTGKVIWHNTEHLDFDVVNNLLVVMCPDNLESPDGLKFDVWTLPQTNGSKDMHLLYSLEHRHPEIIYSYLHELKIRFDGVQLWAYLCYRSDEQNYVTVTGKDFTC